MILASTDSVAVARACADRMIVFAEGLLVFDGPVGAFTDEIASRRLREAHV